MRKVPPSPRLVCTLTALGCALVVALPSLSAHVIRGLHPAGQTTAFVSSPSTGTDAPVSIKWSTDDSGLRVACFYVANTSPERLDRPGWPRVIGAGFELPGRRTGFALLEPLDGGWELTEGERLELAGELVTLDFAVVARMPPASLPRRWSDPPGIRPGQEGVRGSGTRFCVSGPFPDQPSTGEPTSIEQLINGVVVGFSGVAGAPRGDFGIWDNAARSIPLYPD